MKRILISVILAIVMALGTALPALAADPIVTITIYADIITITNSQDTWAAGHVTAGGAAKYFSATNAQDDDYSLITNTGNQVVDIALQGTSFEGGAYDWTLGAAAGDKIYSLFANKLATATVYDVEVKSAPAYSDITAAAGLAKAATNAWSMKLTPPTVFDAADAGASKSATVTLVARLHT